MRAAAKIDIIIIKSSREPFFLLLLLLLLLLRVLYFWGIIIQFLEAYTASAEAPERHSAHHATVTDATGKHDFSIITKGTKMHKASASPNKNPVMGEPAG